MAGDGSAALTSSSEPEAGKAPASKDSKAGTSTGTDEAAPKALSIKAEDGEGDGSGSDGDSESEGEGDLEERQEDGGGQLGTGATTKDGVQMVRGGAAYAVALRR